MDESSHKFLMSKIVTIIRLKSLTGTSIFPHKREAKWQIPEKVAEPSISARIVINMGFQSGLRHRKTCK